MLVLPLVLVLVAVVSRPSPAIIHRAQKLGLLAKTPLCLISELFTA